LLHVFLRTGSLLLLGIMMVNDSPSTAAMGWSETLWSGLMFAAAILAFSTFSPSRKAGPTLSRPREMANLAVRIGGFGLLLWLAFAYRGNRGEHIISLAPFSIRHSWYGILGLIGWGYLAASIVYLLFRRNRTALLASAVLLMCLYPADEAGLFRTFFVSHYVHIGEALGSLSSIGASGVLLSVLVFSDPSSTPGQNHGVVLRRIRTRRGSSPRTFHHQ
jgi:hypothetical protein